MASANDEAEYVLDGGDNPIMHQEEFFKPADHGVNAVFEIGLEPRLGVVGIRGAIGVWPESV